MQIDRTRHDLVEMSRTIDPAVLGRRIRTARQAAGLTQAQLAGEVTAAYLSRIESGERRPEFTLLEQMAKRAGVTVHQLMLGLGSDQQADLQVKLEEIPFLIRTGAFDEATAALTEAAGRLDGTPDSDVLSEIAYLRALVRQGSGDVAGAIGDLRAMLDEDAGGIGARRRIAAAVALADAYLAAGRLGEATTTADATLTSLEDVDLTGAPEALALATTLARAALLRGDHSAAAAACRRVHSSPMGDVDLAAAYRRAAEKELTNRNDQVAVEYARAAASLEEQTARVRTVAGYQATLGALLLLDPGAAPGQSAQDVLTAAAGALDGTGVDEAASVEVRILLAKAAEQNDDVETARAALAAAPPARSEGAVVTANRCLVLGRLHERKGEHDAARSAFAGVAAALREAVQVLPAVASTAARLWFELGEIYDELDDVQAAGEAYREAARLTTGVGGGLHG